MLNPDNLVISLLDALDAIHRVGIVHRDIKPSNIIYDPLRGSVKIIDFGCADSVDSAVLKSRAGTPRYTPVREGDSQVPPLPADDLYALGMTIAELAGTVSSKKDRKRLMRFASRLIDRNFRSAVEARKTFESGRLPWRRLALAALLAAVAVGSLFFIFRRPEGVSENVPVADTSGRPNLMAEAVETPRADSASADLLTVPDVAGEEGETSMTDVPEPAMKNQPKENEPDRAQENRESNPYGWSDIEMKVINVGGLFNKFHTHRATPAEEAEAISIMYADTIFKKNVREEIRGKEFTGEEEVNRIASSYAKSKFPELKKRLKSAGLDNPDLAHCKELFYHRIRMDIFTMGGALKVRQF